MSSHRIRIVVALGVSALISPVAAFADPGAPSSENAPPAIAGDAVPAPRAGSWAHVDPQTGQRIPERPRGVAVPADPALSTSHAGLVEQPAPGGGMMIDLQGRFRSAGTAGVGPDGKAHVGCLGPGAADRQE